MANCLWGQYGGGILRYVPKIRTPRTVAVRTVALRTVALGTVALRTVDIISQAVALNTNLLKV